MGLECVGCVFVVYLVNCVLLVKLSFFILYFFLQQQNSHDIQVFLLKEVKRCEEYELGAILLVYTRIIYLLLIYATRECITPFAVMYYLKHEWDGSVYAYIPNTVKFEISQLVCVASVSSKKKQKQKHKQPLLH